MQSNGWDVQEVQPKASGDLDVPAIWKATLNAMKANQPSFIILQSTIGWPAPESKGTSKIHGNLLSAEESDQTQKLLNFIAQKEFGFSGDVRHQAAMRFEKRKEKIIEHDRYLQNWFTAHPKKFEIW